MNKSIVTAGLIILLTLSVMGTAFLSYYYVLTIRDLGRSQINIVAIQQKQNQVNALIHDAVTYSKTNQAILPILNSLDKISIKNDSNSNNDKATLEDE